MPGFSGDMLIGLVGTYSTFPNIFSQSDPWSNIPSPAGYSDDNIGRWEGKREREIQMMILGERDG